MTPPNRAYMMTAATCGRFHRISRPIVFMGVISRGCRADPSYQKGGPPLKGNLSANHSREFDILGAPTCMGGKMPEITVQGQVVQFQDSVKACRRSIVFL